MMRRLALAFVLALLAGRAEARIERAYIGSFTQTPNGRSGRGIYLVAFDTATGTLSAPKRVAEASLPSWLVIGRTKGVLYSANSGDDFTDPKTGHKVGSVSAWRIDRATGALTLINQVSAGDTPVALALDPSGKYLLSANYDDGSATVYPIRPDGGLGNYTDIVRPTGPLHPGQAADEPPGNLAISAHNHSHVHYVGFDPGGRYVLFNDAGLDNVLVFSLDAQAGTLKPVFTQHETPGSAPRHFVFDASGRRFYNLLEHSLKVTFSSFDPATGTLTKRQTISAMPDDFAGSALSSEILMSRDGHYIYAGIRIHDTIAAFRVSDDGRLTRLGEVPTGADHPRSLAIDPSGAYLFSMNEVGDSITVFRLPGRNGVPEPLHHFTPVDSPAAMVFLDD